MVCCALHCMSFFPCYILFNEHEFNADSDTASDACFPFNISGVWEPAAQSLTLSKQRSYASTSCSPVLHVESSPSSVPCCISSLECVEEEELKESMPAQCESISPAPCSTPSPMDIHR